MVSHKESGLTVYSCAGPAFQLVFVRCAIGEYNSAPAGRLTPVDFVVYVKDGDPFRLFAPSVRSPLFVIPGDGYAYIGRNFV
jgi:hypothetical protein